MRPVSVRTSDIELSGLASAPVAGPARGLILALHGGGSSAGYWNCPADGGRLSLLALAATLGFHALAVDRPGYGVSERFDPLRLDHRSQVAFLFDAVESFSRAVRFDGPIFVVGHSVGGILALLMAADERGARLCGIDVLGVPLRYPPSAGGNDVMSWSTAGTHVLPPGEAVRKTLLYGPDGAYSREASDYDRTLGRPMPVAEYRDALAVPEAWARILPTIRIPVQLSMAEHEVMQITGPEALREARALLSGSVHAHVHLQRATGHNASLHHVGRAYHMRAIAFFEECLALQCAGWP